MDEEWLVSKVDITNDVETVYDGFTPVGFYVKNSYCIVTLDHPQVENKIKLTFSLDDLDVENIKKQIKDVLHSKIDFELIDDLKKKVE